MRSWKSNSIRIFFFPASSTHHWTLPFSRSATQTSSLFGTRVKACGMKKLFGGSTACWLKFEKEFFPHCKKNPLVLKSNSRNFSSHLQNLLALKIELEDSTVAISISHEKVSILKRCNSCWFAEKFRWKSRFEGFPENELWCRCGIFDVETENLMKCWEETWFVNFCFNLMIFISTHQRQ